MKVGILIGSLGFGGAETQLIRLACGLVRRGHKVSVLCYDGESRRDQELRSVGVDLLTGTGGSKGQKLALYRDWAKEVAPNVVHAFMKRASILAILGKSRNLRFPVIASDLSTATYHRSSPALWVSLIAFSRANVVATQTRLNERSLHLLAPWLRKKTVVIRNGLDLARFNPVRDFPAEPPFRFAVVGSVYHVKNPLAVAKAVRFLAQDSTPPFVVDWYGRKGLKGDSQPSPEYLDTLEFLNRYNLQSQFIFHGETNPILPAYQSSHCLLHASLQEGFPNAVVEGMACGLPIAVSRVSDLPLVVQTANNGYLFDEKDPKDIAKAMKRILETDRTELAQMGTRSRRLAEEWFGLERFIDEYEQLYQKLVGSAK
jgi:glycosyltransferase involved in cell wall biosynthesis